MVTRDSKTRNFKISKYERLLDLPEGSKLAVSLADLELSGQGRKASEYAKQYLDYTTTARAAQKAKGNQMTATPAADTGKDAESKLVAEIEGIMLYGPGARLSSPGASPTPAEDIAATDDEKMIERYMLGGFCGM